MDSDNNKICTNPFNDFFAIRFLSILLFQTPSAKITKVAFNVKHVS
jgi:hypothetical protein